MKFKINPAILRTILSRIQGGLGGHTLGAKSIQIVVKPNLISFCTNNSKISYIYTTTEASIESPGTVMVDSECFMRIIFIALSSEILIENIDKVLFIYDGRRKAEITILEDSDFLTPIVATEVIAEMDLAKLQCMLKSAVSVASSNNTIYDGIFIDNEIIAATDMAKAIIIPFKSNLKYPIIIGKDAAKEIIKLDYSGKVLIKSDGSFLTISIDSDKEIVIISVRLLFGDYPDVRKLAEMCNYVEYVAIPLEAIASEISYMAIAGDSEQICNMTINEAGDITFQAETNLGTNKIVTNFDFDVFDSVVPEGQFLFAAKTANLLAIIKALQDYHESVGLQNTQLKMYFVSNSRPIKIETNEMTQFIAAIKV